MKDRIVFLDTETSGMAKEDRIIELGMVEMIGDKITDRRVHEFVNPGRKIHWAAQRVHGIRDRDLVGKPDFSQIRDKVLSFIGTSASFAHNAAFDGRMLSREWRMAGLEEKLWPRVRCTMPIASSIITGKINLDALTQRYLPHRQVRGKHSAMEDAMILAEVFLAMRRDNPEKVRAVMMSMGLDIMGNLRFPSKHSNLGNVTPKESYASQEGGGQRKPQAPAKPEKQEIREDVLLAITKANMSGDMNDVMAVKTGRDWLSRTGREVLFEKLNDQQRLEADKVSNEARRLSAMRMMIRGMLPELAVRREERLAELYDKPDDTPGFGY